MSVVLTDERRTVFKDDGVQLRWITMTWMIEIIHGSLQAVLEDERKKVSSLYPELQPIWWRTGGQPQRKPSSTSSQPGHTEGKHSFSL